MHLHCCTFSSHVIYVYSIRKYLFEYYFLTEMKEMRQANMSYQMTNLVENRCKEKAVEVWQKMQLLARVVLEMRKLNAKNNLNLSTCITLLNFDNLL